MPKLTHRALRIAGALALALLLVAPTVAAQGVTNKAIAEALFQQGRELMKDKKYAEACPKFEQSQKLEQKLGTLINLALCHEGQGRTATAWAEFTEAANMAKRRNEDKREEFAREHVTALQAKLSMVVLRSGSATKDLTVTMDGTAFDLGMLGTPLPMDPGPHKVDATAPGKKTWSQTVLVPEGPTVLEITIGMLEDVDAPPPAPPSTAPPPDPGATEPPPAAPAPPPPPPDTTEGGASVLAMVGFGIAGVGLLVGTITGIVSLSKTSDLKDICPNDVCAPGDKDDISSANTMANVSNVSFVLAGIGAIVGVIGLLTGGSSGSDAAVTLAPIGPESVGLRVRF